MTWNHLVAAISRSQLDVTKLKSDRGRRFHGKSTMSLQKLISHGLSAVSVYLDVAMIRILVLSALMMLVALVGVLTVELSRFWAMTDTTQEYVGRELEVLSVAHTAPGGQLIINVKINDHD